MTWFKVDDKLHDHRKARAAGCAAMGLWALAGSWAADNLTDGFVPDTVCQRWDKTYRRLAGRLVDVGLWDECIHEGEAGWRFHEWTERQPTREQVEAERAASKERQKYWRDRKRDKGVSNAVTNAVTDSVSNGVSHVTPTRPDPTRPTSRTKEGGLRLETLPPDPTRCATHQSTPGDPGPCRGCMKAREAASARFDQARTEAADIRRDCPHCDDNGWITDDNGMPAGRCTHQATA